MGRPEKARPARAGLPATASLPPVSSHPGRPALTSSTEPRTTSDTLCRSSAAVPGLLSARVNFRVSAEAGSSGGCDILPPPPPPPAAPRLRPGRAAARCAPGARPAPPPAPGADALPLPPPRVRPPQPGPRPPPGVTPRAPRSACSAPRARRSFEARGERQCVWRQRRPFHATRLPARPPPRGGVSGAARGGAADGQAGGGGAGAAGPRAGQVGAGSSPGEVRAAELV